MGIMIDGALIGGMCIDGKTVGGMAQGGKRLLGEPVLPPIGTALDDCTWRQISDIANAGLAEQYFAVGDCKEIAISGDIIDNAVDGTYCVYILGFDHNGATNSIDFGTFKSTIDGTDLALSSTATRFAMEPTNTNTCGWQSCNMRYAILGSTDVDGGDATARCAINPMSGTLMAALPLDLRVCMKPMTLIAEQTTVDYLPLLSEFEVFGETILADASEAENQAQYQYFANGGSKIKYKHNAVTSVVGWHERSPVADNSTNFCCLNTSHGQVSTPAKNARGIAPIFRV